MQNLKFCIFYLTKTYIKVIIIVWISNNLAYSRMGGEIVASTNKVEEQDKLSENIKLYKLISISKD